jgi:hypothetical protein
MTGFGALQLMAGVEETPSRRQNLSRRRVVARFDPYYPLRCLPIAFTEIVQKTRFRRTRPDQQNFFRRVHRVRHRVEISVLVLVLGFALDADRRCGLVREIKKRSVIVIEPDY